MNKQRYINLCMQEATIPVFSQPWWLDATAGEAGWDVVLVEQQGKVTAALPYVLQRRFGHTVLGQPLLTQKLGPWIGTSTTKYASRLAHEKDVLQALFDELPDFSYYRQNWHYACTNWLPLYWKGFSQTTRYTYRIENLTDMDSIWARFRGNIRSDIRKAQNKEKLTIYTDRSVEDFLCLNKKVFSRQGMTKPYSDDFVRRIDRAAAGNNARRIFIAEDEQGRQHAGVYLIWDAQSAYYLMGGGDPELRNSGATSLCMWEAIQFAANVTQSFDFEGSMLEPVERFFRAFGAIQTPYFSVSKVNSGLLKTAFFLRDLKMGFKS